jgi:uncharacterized metal-binding protein
VLYWTVFQKQRSHNYDWKAWPAMQKLLVDQKETRSQLKSKRDLLFEEYSKNPMNTRLAIEIKLIDDQIAALTEHQFQRRKAGLN